MLIQKENRRLTLSEVITKISKRYRTHKNVIGLSVSKYVYLIIDLFPIIQINFYYRHTNNFKPVPNEKMIFAKMRSNPSRRSAKKKTR